MNQCPYCGTRCTTDPSADAYRCLNPGCTMDTWWPCDCGQYIDELPDNIVHCFVHHLNEAVPVGGAYRICGECQHVYATAAHLVAAYANAAEQLNKVADEADGEIAPMTSADDVWFCQFCLHDF